MALDYTTKSGDTWDLIALNVYGSELKADWLMQNNPELICSTSYCSRASPEKQPGEIDVFVANATDIFWEMRYATISQEREWERVL